MAKIVLDIVYKILGLIIGIAVAVGVYLLVPAVTGADKFILSLLGSILSIIVVEFIKQGKEFKDLDKKLDSVIEDPVKGTAAQSQALGRAKAELAELRSVLADRFRGTAEVEAILSYPNGSLTPGKVEEVWLDLIWRCNQEYLATNYIKVSELYQTAYAQAALKIQETKLKTRNVVIKKVFIVPDSDPQELKDVDEILEEQKSAGIQVRKITHGEIHREPYLREGVEKLETIDFGVFDSRFVLLWHLDDDRCVKSGNVLVRQKVDEYKIFFDKLFLAAKPL